MKSSLILLLGLLLLTSAGARGEPCSPGRGARVLAGPPSVVSILRANLARQNRDLLFKDGTFDEERFSYVGEVVVPHGGKWHVALLDTTWGCSGRSTRRLLVFSEAKSYVGQYSHFMPDTPRIVGDTIFFDDASPNVGNAVRFSIAGPPKQARLDGEILEFYR